MNKNNLLFQCTFVLCLLAISACYLDETDPGVVTIEYSNLGEFYEAKGVALQTFDENLDSELVITGKEGTVIRIGQNDLITPNATIATGKVKVELREIYTKSQMILSNMTTSSQGEVLESGGQMYLTVTNAADETLSLKSGANLSAMMPKSNSSTIANPGEMTAFYGIEDLGFSWIQDQNGSVDFDSIGDSFNLLTNRFGWINCDYFYQTTTPKTTVRFGVSLPNSANIEVAAFMVFTDINSVMGLNYSTTDKEFFKSNIPTNESVSLIVIGMDATSFYFAQEDIVTSNNLDLNLMLNQISETSLINNLNSLN
ncbi:MAG: hypothetical protein AB8G15_22165 [Saprospiraceae bacterium]